MMHRRRYTPGAGAGIPLRRAAGIVSDCTGNVVPGEDEARLRRVAEFMEVTPDELIAAVEDELARREFHFHREYRLQGRRLA